MTAQSSVTQARFRYPDGTARVAAEEIGVVSQSTRMTRKTEAKQTREMPKCEAITGGVCGYFTAQAPIPDCRTSVNSVSGMSVFSSGQRRRSGKAVTDRPRM